MTDDKQGVNPRETGKVHRHEEIVRPILVKNIVQTNPLKDMYDDGARKHKTRDIALPMRTVNIHLTELLPGQSSKIISIITRRLYLYLKGRGIPSYRASAMTGSRVMPCTCRP